MKRVLLASLIVSILASGCTTRPPHANTSTTDAAATETAAREEKPPRRAITCTPDPSFPGSLDVAEASAAAEIERDGKRELVVLSDSGELGAGLAYALPAGPARAFKLPLDMHAGDDTEGVAWRGGHLFVLTSSGGVERFTPDPKTEWRRDGAAYPIGPDPLACTRTLDEVNCGKNYEGLCLRSASSRARCAGYAASKRDDTLHCLVFEGDKLVADRIKPPLKLALKPEALSDCAFGASDGPARDTLLVTTNVYGGSTTYVVDETNGELGAIDLTGTPNNEAIAVDEHGDLYQFMDSNGKPSLALRANCVGW